MIIIKKHYNLEETTQNINRYELVVARLSVKFKARFLWHKAFYDGDSMPMKVCCKTHGYFKATPRELLLPSSNCPKCIAHKEKHIAKNYCMKEYYTDEKYLKQVSTANPLYPLQAKFKGFDKPVYVKCHTHGPFRIKNPRILLKLGCHCPACKRADTRLTNEEFIAKASLLHDNRYTYSNTKYQGSREPVIVTCQYHGDFKIKRAADHYINGNGCPSCFKGGFRGNLPGTLYYVSINKGAAYKIGITNGSVKTRFSSADLKKITIIKTWYFHNGQECRDKERSIIESNTENRYTGPTLLGITEMFNHDILQLDKG